MIGFEQHDLDHQRTMTRPLVIGVGGFTSEVGKTTLLCELLRAFPGWEAIKMTRGHYRSCGKDPQICCVSHLLEDKAVVRSGRELTYEFGKDTGRYWDAGAANVHWVIATDEQVKAGIELALSRVNAEGVFVEGNSFTKFVEPDFFVMVTQPDNLKIKKTAKEALANVSAYYVSGAVDSSYRAVLEVFHKQKTNSVPASPGVLFGEHDFNQLVSSINGFISSVAA